MSVISSDPLRADAAAAWLSDLDYELLELVCRLRVVTQKQVERLNAHVPDRTLRYRARRLHRFGLLGRTRPYRDRGSAPYHLWPTNRGDALMRADPPPRRGERAAPSPLFLAHTAAVSELYVVLRTSAADASLTLVDFRREGEAREAFEDADGRERAIAPDARIALRDAGDAELVGNVELDLGTMTHARLRTKLEGYLAHAAHGARGETPSALLFITVSSARAEAFLRAARKLAAADRWRHAADLRIAACALARRPDGLVSKPCWRDTRSDAALTLSEALRTASWPAGS